MQPTTVQPSKSRTFDVSRAVLEDYGKAYSPARLDVTAYQPLDQVLASGQITLDDRLLTFMRGGMIYAVPMSIVLAYNVMQGKFDDGRSWLMTFCNACNTGMVFDPTLKGQSLHFQRRGAYDGLMLIYDEETGSYWQHITGESLYGASAGSRIQMITMTKMMAVREVVRETLPVHVPVHTLSPGQQMFSQQMAAFNAYPERYEKGITATIGQEDIRRPRFELGLGISEGAKGLFVPLNTLHVQNNVALTEFNGRGVIVYLHPDAVSPTAVYAETQSARWEGNTLRIDGGVIRDDQLVLSGGEKHPLERPTQLLMRWFGFALTFPNSSILVASVPD